MKSQVCGLEPGLNELGTIIQQCGLEKASAQPRPGHDQPCQLLIVLLSTMNFETYSIKEYQQKPYPNCMWPDYGDNGEWQGEDKVTAHYGISNHKKPA